MENTSGLGKSAVIPEGVRGWSWGAFLLNVVWGVFNKTYIALLCLIPFVGFVLPIILGIKGREWAWRNKKWESVEQFDSVQKKWSVWAVILIGSLIVGGVLLGLLLGLLMRFAGLQ